MNVFLSISRLMVSLTTIIKLFFHINKILGLKICNCIFIGYVFMFIIKNELLSDCICRINTLAFYTASYFKLVQ